MTLDPDSSFTFTDPGFYAVKLHLSGPYGESWGGALINIAADFEATPISGPAPLKVTFTDKSRVDGITSRVWHYKLNTASTWTTFTLDEDSSFTFSEPGMYDVQLTVSTPSQGPSTATKSITVNKPILLVHGWGGSEANWEVIKPELERNGYTVENWHYDSSQRADYCAQNYLAPKVEEMLEKYNTSKIDIIAHSYGGLVSRSYLEKFGGDKKVDHFIMFFTPKKGTIMADYMTGERSGYYSDNLDWILNIIAGFNAKKDWESNYDLRASSNNQFLVDLNNNFNAQGKKYYVIAGTVPYPDTWIQIPILKHEIKLINVGKPLSNAKVSPGRDDGFITMSSVRGLPGVPSYCAELDHSDVNPWLQPDYDGPTLSLRLNTIRSVVDNVVIPALNDTPVIIDNCPTTPDPYDDAGLTGFLGHTSVRLKIGESATGNFKNNGIMLKFVFSWDLPEPTMQSNNRALYGSSIPNFTFSLVSPSHCHYPRECQY